MQTTAAQATPAFRTDTIPAGHQLAVGMAMECFGTGSAEALRFTRYVVQRNGLEWLTNEETAAGFDEFWSIYPRKEGRPAALAVWLRLNPNAHTRAQIMGTLHRVHNSRLWQGANARFIPLPAAWLHGERWKSYVTEAQPAQANPQPLPEQHPALGKPHTKTLEADPATAQRDHLQSATTLQRAARLGQKALRRFGISVSWAPSCGVIGCVENASLATGQGARPLDTARNSERGAA